MIKLNTNDYQVKTQNNPTMGIMTGSMPSGGFKLPNNQRNPFAGFDDAGFRDLQARTEQEGRRISLDEYTGLGGNTNEYHKLYGGLAPGAFEGLQAQYQSGGKGRIPYEAWVGAGGNPNEYYKIYGDNPQSVGSNPYQDIFNNQLQSNYTQAGIDSSLNRINEINPYGSSQYITNPDGTVSRVSSLSGSNQQLLDQQNWQDISRNNLVGGMLENYASNYDPVSQDHTGEAQRAEQSVLDRYNKDLDRRFSQEEAALRNRLVNSGYAPTSERFQRELADLERRKSESYTTARDQAIGQGREQGNYLLNQELQRRNQSLNEMSNIGGQVRGVQNPTFSGNYNVQMPYVDLATPTIGFSDQQTAWAREDALRREAEAKAKKGGGGGRRSSGGSSLSSMDRALENLVLSSGGGGSSSTSPIFGGFTQGAGFIGNQIAQAL